MLQHLGFYDLLTLAFKGLGHTTLIQMGTINRKGSFKGSFGSFEGVWDSSWVDTRQVCIGGRGRLPKPKGTIGDS